MGQVERVIVNIDNTARNADAYNRYRVKSNDAHAVQNCGNANANGSGNQTANANSANAIKRKSLKSFITSNKEEILKTLNDVMSVKFKGLEKPSSYDQTIKRLASLSRRPLARQSRLIAAAYQHLLEKPSVILSAEMGTGKTQMGVSLIHLLNAKRVGIMCPPHLVSKWASEIETILGKGSNAMRPYKIITIGCGEWASFDYYRRMKVRKGESLIFIFSYSAAKLGYRLRKSVVHKKTIGIVEKTNADGYKVQQRVICDLLVCPDCGKSVFKDKDESGTIDDVKRHCPHCHTVLRQPEQGETRLSLAEYAQRRLPRGWFDLLIADEVHELKGGGTGQGNAFGSFVSRSKKVVGLTGTLLNGYAESVFYILYRLNPRLMKEQLGLEYREVERFIDLYGARERRWANKQLETNIEGIVVKRSGTPAVRNIPKVNPLLLTQLLGTSIFLRLDEMNIALPRYSEIVERVKPDEAVVKEYLRYLEKLIALVRSRSSEGVKKLGELATASLAILGVPNKPRGDNLAAYNPPVARDEAEAKAKGLEYLPITNKEKRLVEIVREELAQGRKCLVYITFTQLGTTEAVLNALREAMPHKVVRVLPDSVDSKRRESWLRANSCDVLITNPEKVKTGLDLLEYPTIIFHQPTYKVYTLKQAARRSWRIGQRQDVKVYFLVYQHTPEEKALQLIARKLSAAGAIEGRIGDGGLADQEADDENIAVSLAKSLIKKEAIDDFAMEEIALGIRESDPFEDYYLSVCEEMDKANKEEINRQRQTEINAKAKAEAEIKTQAEANALSTPVSEPSLFSGNALNAPLASVVKTLKESAVKEEKETEAQRETTAETQGKAIVEAQAKAKAEAQANSETETKAIAETQTETDGQRLTIYRIVKSEGKRIEQRLSVTATELETMIADESQALFQGSLFDF